MTSQVPLITNRDVMFPMLEFRRCPLGFVTLVVWRGPWPGAETIEIDLGRRDSGPLGVLIDRIGDPATVWPITLTGSGS